MAIPVLRIQMLLGSFLMPVVNFTQEYSFLIAPSLHKSTKEKLQEYISVIFIDWCTYTLSNLPSMHTLKKERRLNSVQNSIET